MADNAEQIKLAVQILAQIADRAAVDGPTGRQRDQAIQILAQYHGVESISPPAPPVEQDEPPVETAEVVDP